jgi:hypothetical protein
LARSNASAITPSSRVRPTSGNVARSTSTPSRERTCTASQTGIGSDFPFPTTGSCSAYSTTSRVARYVVSPTSTPFTGASSLQPGSRVDDVACCHPLALGGPRTEQDERLAGVDGDAHLQVVLLARPVADGEGGANRPQRVVVVCDRRPEERHHRVADELLHGAAALLELATQPLPVRREHGADILRIELFRPRGEAHEIGEEHRDDLALLARRLARQRGSAGRAEASVLGVLLAADRAEGHWRGV